MRIHWLRTLLTLALGFMLGAMFAARWGHGRPPWLKEPNLEQRYERLLERFNSKLGLTPEQKELVRAVLEVKRLKIEALRAATKPKFDEIRDSARAEIRKILTPEQQAKFDEMQKRWEARREKRRAP
jgi:Spy/CpxP family protein refolding chaperone